MGQRSNPRRTVDRVLDEDVRGSERRSGARFAAESGLKSDHRQVLRRLQAADIDRLIAAYVEGDSVPRLVRQFSIHRTTVLIHLERHGVARRRSTRKLTDADVARGASLYLGG